MSDSQPDLYYQKVQQGQQLPAFHFEVTTTGIIAGALASRDYSPLHHDKAYATEQAGHADIFLNTPQQAAFFERYLNDWSGPKGRIGRMKFTMKSSVYAGSRISIAGEVIERAVDKLDCAWVGLLLRMTVGGVLTTESRVRYALARDATDNPWRRENEDWIP